MYRIILAGLVLAFVLADCDCDDDGGTGPTNGGPVTPIDTSTAASIDSALIGTWHRTNPVTRNYVRVTDSSITIGLTELTGVRDSNPLFAKLLVARNGQIFFQPDSACSACVNEYLYDYALGPGDTVLYLAAEYTDARTNPTASTPDVIILSRDTISATTDLSLISDTLIGAWHLYDSTGTVRVQPNYLVVTADSIVLTRGAVAVTLKGYWDPGGSFGRTLVARNGQVWYDYHADTSYMYWHDYSVVADGRTMYLVDDHNPEYTAPGVATPAVAVLKK